MPPGSLFTLKALTAVLTASMLVACGTANRYDTLKALPIDQVMPAAALSELPRPRLGIAFGGGGVRGFTHLGAMRALNEAGVRANVVTGTSVGAAAAALYASGLSLQQIETLALSVSEFQLLDLVINRQGVVNGRAFAAWLRKATGERRIGQLPVPLGVTVTDLVTGRAMLVVEGDVGEAVQASASVPGTVIPVQSGAAHYVDGGVLTVLPVRFTRALGADVVIAIDIFCGAHPPPKGNAVDTVFKSFRLQSCTLGEAEAAEADFLVRPSFEPTNPTSFGQREQAIQAGYQAMKEVLPEVLVRIASTATKNH